MGNRGPTKEHRERMIYLYKLRRYRRMVNAAEHQLTITAPICPDVLRSDEPVEPLSEEEFEQQMQIGFSR